MGPAGSTGAAPNQGGAADTGAAPNQGGAADTGAAPSSGAAANKGGAPSAGGATRGPVTLSDVARGAGVSIATASFVLSGRAGAPSAGSPQTKAKVRAAAERLGYVPNRNAQAMRTGRGGGIVLALGVINDPWSVGLAEQVRADALPHDLSTLILADERWFEYISGNAADCAFLTSIDFEADGPEKVRRLSANSHSGLVAFSATMEPERFDVIHSSPHPAIHDAYRRLRTRHDRVQLLAPHRLHLPGGTQVPHRTQTFYDAAREHGDGPAEDLVRTCLPGGRESYRTSLEWLSGPARPEAVICYTGYQAVALQSAAERLGIRQPDDLEIISIGDVPAESQYYGPISYYGVQDVFSRISEVVVGRARDRSDRPGELHTFDWEFFAGDTTRDPQPAFGPPAANDPEPTRDREPPPDPQAAHEPR